jgi:mono/diheme cytochrome c family protein
MRIGRGHSTVIGSTTLALACMAGATCGRSSETSQTASDAIRRGKYLVTVGGCNDCHTTKTFGPNGPQPDASRLLAGHPESMKMPPPPHLEPQGPWGVVASPTLTAWSGPWGVSFAANLTPDQNTGIGTWTKDMFVHAMRSGKHMGVSRPILPPMPWQDFATMPDADLDAIYEYLRTIPPIVNHVPDPIPPPEAGAQ